MIQKIVFSFLFSFLFLSTSVHAEYDKLLFKTKTVNDERGCGSIPGIDFNRYSCPMIKDYESTISSISPALGTYTCVYGKSSGAVAPKNLDSRCGPLYFNNIKKSGDAPLQFELQNKNFDVKNELLKNTEVFGTIVKKNGGEFNEDYFKEMIDTSDVLSSINKISKLSYDLRVAKNKGEDVSKNTFTSFLNNITIDSHSNYTKTLSAALTAVFTADPDFFEPGFLNPLGEVVLKDGNGTHQAGGGVSVISSKGKKVLKFWAETAFNDSYPLSTTNNIDYFKFIDKQVLGYFLNVVSVLKKVYDEMVYLFFIIGGVYSFGFYSYRRALEKYGKEPFNINKMSFLTSAMFAFVFFSAPALEDGELKNAYFDVTQSTNTVKASIYDANAASHPISETTANNWSSLGQETVRYVAQTSNYFANMGSDFVLKTYLGFIGKKEGFLDLKESDIEELASDLDAVLATKKAVLADLKFYGNMCRPYFFDDGKGWFNWWGSTNYDLFDDPSNIGKQKTLVKNPDTAKEVLQNKGNIKANRLSYAACVSLEHNLIPHVEALVDASSALKKKVEGYRKVLNGSDESLQSLKEFISVNAWAENRFGWIWSASTPMTYFFFDNAEVFLYDQENGNAIDENVFADALTTRVSETKTAYGDGQELSEKARDLIEDGVISVAGAVISQFGAYGVLPGFGSIQTSIKESLMSFVPTPFGEKKGDGKKAASYMQRYIDIMGKRKKGGGLIGMAKGLQDKVLGLGYAGRAVMSAAIIAFSYAAAVYIYIMLVNAVTIMILTTALIMQITLYFIELMLFYVSVPLKGVYYVLMGGGQSKDHFGHFSVGMISLFLAPQLIVLVTAMIIPVGKFFKSFFTSIVSLITATIQETTRMVSDATGRAETVSKMDEGIFSSIWRFVEQDIIGDSNESIQRIMTVIGLKSMTEMFSLFAFLLVSLILIMNFKSWFFKYIGLEGGVDTFKETFSEARQGTQYKALNPVG